MSSATYLRRAGIGGLSALVCAGTALIAAGAPANAATPGQGEIGIVDTSTTTAGTQGATAVTPGSGRALADVQLLIPNDFAANDTITLALADSNGYDLGVTNQLKFSGLPTVTVDPKLYTSASQIGPTAADTKLVAEATPGSAVAPTFAKDLKPSGARAHGANDTLELKASANAAGSTNDFWLVTISDIKVDVGPNIDPGEIRVIPFGSDFPGNTDVATPVTTGQYTVAGFVLPAAVAVANPSGVTGDGTAQAIGDININELVNTGMTAGTYTITVHNAEIENNATNKVTGSVVIKANGESVTDVVTDQATDTIKFKFNQADPLSSAAATSMIKLQGLLLSSTGNGQITYTLSGGSIDAPLTVDANANQKDIQPPALPQATGTSLGDNNRISGADRYGTAAKIALRNSSWGDPIVLAAGRAFPDALSAGFLSQRLGGASVLLTEANTLPAATANALRQLGTTTVYVVGGNVAINQSVVDDVKAIAAGNAGLFGTSQVTRLSGADRYATNEAVNNAASGIGVGGIGSTTITFGEASKKTALLATGADFADALAATPATAGNGSGALPLILTRGTALSPTAKDQIDGFGIKQVVIVGGTDVVSSSVESTLTGMGVAVKRIAGATRYETATALAAFEMDAPAATDSKDEGGLGFDTTGDEAFLATGQAFADALAGGPLAANNEAPILLTTGSALQSATQAFLVAHKADFDSVTALGGPVAIADAVVQAANTAIIG